MSQINDNFSIQTVNITVDDTSIKSADNAPLKEADTPDPTQPAPLVNTQAEQRLQKMLANAARDAAGFAGSVYESIKTEMPRPSRFHNDTNKIISAALTAAKKCDAAMQKLGTLSLNDLKAQPINDEHFNIVKEYVDAQNELYGAVNTYLNKTHSKSPLLNSLLQTTQFRASEALNLLGGMQILGKEFSADAARSNADNLQLKNEHDRLAEHFAVLDTKESALRGMQCLSPAMHGSVFLQEVQKNIADLFAKIEQLEAGQNELAVNVFQEKARDLKNELNILKDKLAPLQTKDETDLQALKENYAQNKAAAGENEKIDSLHVMQLDKSLAASMNAYINRMETRLAKITETDPKAVLSKAIGDLFQKYPVGFSQKLEYEAPVVQKVFADIENVFSEVNEFIENLQKNVQAGTCSPEQLQDKLTNVTRELYRNPALSMLHFMNSVSEQRCDLIKFSRYVNSYGRLSNTEVRTLFNFSARINKNSSLKHVLDVASEAYRLSPELLASECNELVSMLAKHTDNLLSLDKDYLLDALEHTINMNTVVEAKMRGIPTEQLQTAVSDDILESHKVLGQGAANTVDLCVYHGKDGEDVKLVFKPEVAARHGLAHLLASQLGYTNNTRVMQLNIAANYSAESIGCENTIARSRIGSYRGRFGLFMEAAPGATFKNIKKNVDAKCGINSKGEEFSFNDTCRILRKKGLYSAMRANLMQELSRLEWADILSGQVDRHGDNYLVSINTDTGAVKVTGIDNDASFGERKIGINQVVVDGNDNLIRKFRKAVTSGPHGNVLDTSFLKNGGLEELRRNYGFNQLFAPAHIDRNTFTKLMALDENAYRAKLSTCLSPEAVNAAMLRLQDAKQYARFLEYQGKVVDDWNKPAIYYELWEQSRKAGEGTYTHALRLGFFARDFISMNV